MFKCLVVIALLIGGAQKNVPLNGKQQQNQSQAHPTATHPPTPPAAASEVAQENAANAERYTYYKAHPKEYLKVLSLLQTPPIGFGGIGLHWWCSGLSDFAVYQEAD